MRDTHAQGRNTTGERRRTLIGVGLALVLLVGTVGTAAALAQDDRTAVGYRAFLSGDNEVPPVETDASGRSGLRHAVTAEFLAFELQVENIEDVLAAHIHLGQPGENGPVVAFLYSAAEPMDFDRDTISSDRIRVDDLLGPLAGDWDGFVAALDAGGLYINVHTTANPSGEIRGQIERHTNGDTTTTTMAPTTTTMAPTTTTMAPTTTTMPPTTTTTTTMPPTTTTTTTTMPPTTTTTTTMPPGDVEATMFEFGYNPETITISTGTSVEWENVGSLPHTVTSGEPGNPNGIFDSGIVSSGGSYSRVFNTVGSFDYFCTVHPGQMSGTVVVTG